MTVRIRLAITGLVQGVGFRPAVARIAHRHGVSGFIYNDPESVQCELQGTADNVAAAVAELQYRPPPAARVHSVRQVLVSPEDGESPRNVFSILDSRGGGTARTLVAPDIAVCGDCLAEMRDSTNRRFGHALITCTNCGPRYTVTVDLPYDRPHTTLAGFRMCPACAVEYADPGNRRFHAQTISCMDCGPTLRWRGISEESTDPIDSEVAALNAGHIVAIKGIGGFHLACRADRSDAVGLLRIRKSRPAKPFAIMVADIRAAMAVVSVDDAAANLLSGPPAPIVLLPQRGDVVAKTVAPRLNDLGVMLAYTPVHHQLFDRLGPIPLVMTSANRPGSSILYREGDFPEIERLADGVLDHDRPIHMPCEDSVMALDADGTEVPVRRSRGYAPLPISVAPSGECAPWHSQTAVLATGGDLKCVLCVLGPDGQAYLSPHLGDMADPRAQAEFEKAARHFVDITGKPPSAIACDLHPGYATTALAVRLSHASAVLALQHHRAHAISLLAEHQRLTERMLAVTYDGTGYGIDGNIWGGELLVTDGLRDCKRVGHLLPFTLPGGDGAIRHPARIALDLLWRSGIEWAENIPAVKAVGSFGLQSLSQQIPRGLGCVPTTSMGRLLDAVAGILGVCQEVTYEGQAAIELEQLARRGVPTPLSMEIADGILDPRPMVVGLVEGIRSDIAVADLAAGAHNAIVEATVQAVCSAAESEGINVIGLTGGVFANRILRSGIRQGLADAGFEVLTHRAVPCNDGGLSLGQAVIAATSVRGAGQIKPGRLDGCV